MKSTSIAVVLLLGLPAAGLWAAGGPDAKTVIAGATKALGADNLKTIEFSGSGYDFAIGQAPNPSSPWPRFNDKTYTRVINFDAPASRMQRIRTQAENPPRGGGQQPIVGEQQQTQVVAPGSPLAATLWDDLMMSVPYGFLKAAAAAPDTKVSSKSMGGKKYTVLTFTATNKAAASGYLNGDSVLERVETKIDNTVLGDILFETAFTDYKDFAGLKFPTRIVQKQGGYPVLDLTITDAKPNVPVNIPAVQVTPAPPPPPAPTEKLSDGVYLILGGYAALALDFGDHIVVVEGPQSDQRADAVIAAAKQLIPGKPIKYVVNTHAHFDHAGGLRDFVAEGATVITHQMNKPYYEKVWANPHTLVPDRLAQHPRKPTFKTVAEQMELTGNGHTLELYHMQNFLHNDGMLMVYLPKEKILLEADAFNPPAQRITQTPATISPYNQALVANIDRLKLDVQRIIPVHYPTDNRVTTTAELMKAVGK
ncbi:MAG TPA: MBL fold metallo-hydrolase [Bryobacteraceae bacterium]|nr:MBL fold metallo-hydrolase [Bryobacteraceae bacterium]